MGSSHLSAFPFTRRRRRAALQTGFFQFQPARRVGIAADELRDDSGFAMPLFSLYPNSQMKRITRVVFSLALGWLLCAGGFLNAADSLVWRAKEDRVDAEITTWPLPTLLAKIAKASGWQVFIEPGTTYNASVKFKNLTTDDALHRLLGTLNFVLTQTNGSSQLYVYQTEARAATQQVRLDKGETGAPKDYRIHNELIVRLKKGSKLSIDQLAALVGAKVVGRDDALRIYRLQFADENAANTAKDTLTKNESVSWVDSNYTVDPPKPDSVAMAAGAGYALNPKPTDDCSPIIGLVDTAILPQPGFSNYLMDSVSVVGDVTAPDSPPTHGTAMAETMISTMANNSKLGGAKILPIVVYQNGESTTTFEVTKGVYRAVNAGANPINLSLGGTGDSAALRQLIQEASQQGVVFVAAAGNEPVTTPTYPAAWPGVIAVTASDANGNIAPYANSGTFVKAMVSGDSIIPVNGQLWEFQGTSVSTARVSGMLAGTAAQGCTTPAKVSAEVLATLPVKR